MPCATPGDGPYCYGLFDGVLRYGVLAPDGKIVFATEGNSLAEENRARLVALASNIYFRFRPPTRSRKPTV